MSDKFTIPVTFDNVNRKKDRSASLRFTSNIEVSTDDLMAMDRLLQSEGYLYFGANEVQEGDVPDEPATSKEQKSKGHRLRAVHFLIWKQSGTEEPFETWYDRRFEALMDKYKDKLD